MARAEDARFSAPTDAVPESRAQTVIAAKTVNLMVVLIFLSVRVDVGSPLRPVPSLANHLTKAR